VNAFTRSHLVRADRVRTQECDCIKDDQAQLPRDAFNNWARKQDPAQVGFITAATVPTVDTGSPFSRHGAPAPLVTAAGLTLVEGLLTVMYGLGEAVHVTSDRLVMGVTTAAFFVAYGAALVLCSWGLNRLRTWARGPVLLAQLIWLGLAWNFRAGETLPLAIGLAVPAVVVLVGMLLPSSVDALENGPRDRP
jgi:hypothetical protein